MAHAQRLLRTLAAAALSVAAAGAVAAPFSARTLEPWSPGTLEPWNPGTLEPWNPATLEPLRDESARFTRTITIAPGVPITLEASVGDISITGWDRPETAVDIVRRAPSEALLATFEPSVEQTSDRVAIRAVQPGGAFDRSITSTIRINLPSSTPLGSVSVLDGRIVLTNLTGSISANTREGSIAASRLSGIIRLETLTGDITLEEATLVPQGLIRLRAFNGQIKLEFAKRPESARILAVTFNGTISTDLPMTMKDRFGPRFGEATIGAGSPLVSIDVVTGNIQIKAPGK